MIQPPLADGEPLRLHQVKSKTGTLNSSGGKRLAEQMRNLRMAYPGAELYSHSLVGNTLRGHRSMGGMRRAEPAMIVMVGDASFHILTGSENGAELLLRLYQAAFELAAAETGYSVETITRSSSHSESGPKRRARAGSNLCFTSRREEQRRIWTAGRIVAVDVARSDHE